VASPARRVRVALEVENLARQYLALSRAVSSPRCSARRNSNAWSTSSATTAVCSEADGQSQSLNVARSVGLRAGRQWKRTFEDFSVRPGVDFVGFTVTPTIFDAGFEQVCLCEEQRTSAVERICAPSLIGLRAARCLRRGAGGPSGPEERRPPRRTRSRHPERRAFASHPARALVGVPRRRRGHPYAGLGIAVEHR